MLAIASGVLLAGAGITIEPAQARTMGNETFATSRLAIETASAARHRFHIELAITSAQQAQGLMYRKVMAADAGMLFIFEDSRQASFWMKNTLIPLDLLFVRADGRIANIRPMAEPLSLAGLNSDGPVKAVLEINGGMAARLGIRAGDRVLHPAFGDLEQ